MRDARSQVGAERARKVGVGAGAFWVVCRDFCARCPYLSYIFFLFAQFGLSVSVRRPPHALISYSRKNKLINAINTSSSLCFGPVCWCYCRLWRGRRAIVVVVVFCHFFFFFFSCFVFCYCWISTIFPRCSIVFRCFAILFIEYLSVVFWYLLLNVVVVVVVANVHIATANFFEFICNTFFCLLNTMRTHSSGYALLWRC